MTKGNDNNVALIMLIIPTFVRTHSPEIKKYEEKYQGNKTLIK